MAQSPMRSARMNGIILLFWWFLFGQLAFVLWLGHRFSWKQNQNTIWRDDGGERYEYREERSKNDALGNIVMSFAVPAGIGFKLRPETWLDRFSKALRLTHEPQLGDAEFDARFFFDADDANIIKWWRQNEALHSPLNNLIKRLATQRVKMYSLDLRERKAASVSGGTSRTQRGTFACGMRGVVVPTACRAAQRLTMGAWVFFGSFDLKKVAATYSATAPDLLRAIRIRNF